MLKTTISFLVLAFCLKASSEGLQCSSLFEDRSIQVAVFDWKKLTGEALRFEIENRIKQYATEEIAKLTPEEKFELRKAAEAIGNQLAGVEARLSFYKKLTGSIRARVILEEKQEMRSMLIELKRGSIDTVVEHLEFDFTQFETNFLSIEALHEELNYMSRQGKGKSPQFKERLEKLNEKQKFFGKMFFRYRAIHELFEDLGKNKIPEQIKFGRIALKKLREKSKIEATRQLLDFHKITLDEIERYTDTSSAVKMSMAYKKARREIWTAAKIALLSGPIMKAVKGIVYRFPEKIPFQKIGIDIQIEPRKAISELLGIAYDQHLRDLFLEKIESIAALEGQPSEAYKALESADSVADKKDELIVAFARVPENRTLWFGIQEYSKSLVDNGSGTAYEKDFHQRLLKAEKKAVGRPLPLYYHEAGVTVISKTVSGLATMYYLLDWYFEKHPEKVDAALSAGQQAMQFLSGG